MKCTHQSTHTTRVIYTCMSLHTLINGEDFTLWYRDGVVCRFFVCCKHRSCNHQDIVVSNHQLIVQVFMNHPHDTCIFMLTFAEIVDSFAQRDYLKALNSLLKA